MLNFIVNTRSGMGRGFKNLQKIIKYCYKNNVEYTVHITNAPKHATRIARALVDNRSSVIVAVGGDGTFHEVLNGIYSFENTVLGFIPSGRGNDFARCAKISTNPIEALKTIIRGQVVNIDYIDVSGVRCLNVCGTGLDIDVLQRVQNKHGKINYLKSLIYCLRHFEPYEMDVTVNGGTKDYKCLMAGICNGTTYGGGMKLSPLSKINDGKINLVIMNHPDDKKIFKLLPKFVSGKHLNMNITTHILCEEVEIKLKKNHPIQLDGEIYADLPFNCKIVKGGIKTFSTSKS